MTQRREPSDRRRGNGTGRFIEVLPGRSLLSERDLRWVFQSAVWEERVVAWYPSIRRKARRWKWPPASLTRVRGTDA